MEGIILFLGLLLAVTWSPPWLGFATILGYMLLGTLIRAYWQAIGWASIWAVIVSALALLIKGGDGPKIFGLFLFMHILNAACVTSLVWLLGWFARRHRLS